VSSCRKPLSRKPCDTLCPQPCSADPRARWTAEARASHARHYKILQWQSPCPTVHDVDQNLGAVDAIVVPWVKHDIIKRVTYAHHLTGRIGCGGRGGSRGERRPSPGCADCWLRAVRNTPRAPVSAVPRASIQLAKGSRKTKAAVLVLGSLAAFAGRAPSRLRPLIARDRPWASPGCRIAGL
jgi:hypothetical protein